MPGFCSCRDLSDFIVVLILILCATIPFLIGMTLFHSFVSKGLRYESIRRDDYCLSLYINESIQDLDSKYEPIHDVCPNYLIDQKIAMVGSLHQISKKGEQITSTFLCPVTFFDRGLAFVGKNCIKKPIIPANYFIRIGSMFADQGGTIHKLLGEFKADQIPYLYKSDLTLLEYYHNIPMDCEFKSLAVTFLYLNATFIKKQIITKVSVFQYEKNDNGQLKLQHYVGKLHDIRTKDCQQIIPKKRRGHMRYNYWICVNFEDRSPSCTHGSLMFLNTVYFLGASIDEDCNSKNRSSFVLYEKVYFFYTKVIRFIIEDYMFRTAAPTREPSTTVDPLVKTYDSMLQGIENVDQFILGTIKNITGLQFAGANNLQEALVNTVNGVIQGGKDAIDGFLNFTGGILG